MPGYERADITAELRVVTSERAERPPRDQIEAAKESAGASGLAHESGPETIMLAGYRKEVLQTMMEVTEAALEAGVRAVEIKVEAEAEADKF